ncbi:hypothetical protein [Paractinoplanes hotanensis]|uniref:Uncharacterized protein n=1 Tax=Paractinoplanes hotanensis TaxID=2906497 RepID=A0ABT0XZR8_9ACTN|nr:hypothetical protein [Actinoplanes hotanensis]MCM4079227.1 hypothetical protein [Actinoplanes hotanensis]
MRALFVTVDGGGNLPPELGIVHEIVRRGGTARFLGHERNAVRSRHCPDMLTGSTLRGVQRPSRTRRDRERK